MEIIRYILNMVELRYSKDMKQSVCGVGQGCPISSYLFCIAINPILQKLSDHYQLTFTAYMDDLLIFIPTDNRYDEIVEFCR